MSGYFTVHVKARSEGETYLRKTSKRVFLRLPHIPTIKFAIWTYIILSWATAAALIYVYFAHPADNDALPNTHATLLNQTTYQALTTLKTGRVIWQEPTSPRRPLFGMQFDQIQIENGQLGIFDSSIHKTINIQNLKIDQYQYDSAPTGNAPHINLLPDQPLIAKLTNATSQHKPAATPSQQSAQQHSWWNKHLDLTNVSQINASSFEYCFHLDNDTHFTIKCKRARLKWNSNGIIMQGHVIITTAEQKTLQSNYVTWDIANQKLKIKGRYTLTAANYRTIGRDSLLDYCLNPLTANNLHQPQNNDYVDFNDSANINAAQWVSKAK